VPHPSTVMLSGAMVAERLEAAVPRSVQEAAEDYVVLEPATMLDAMRVIRDDEQLDGKYLAQMCSVDLNTRIDVVYHFASLAQNHLMQVKVSADHEQPRVASIVPLWRGAILQEREVYDLMGVVFDGHPELTRLFLWDKFPGHPLRKDFMGMPGGQKSGLSQFPKQVPGQTGNEFRPQDPGTGQ